MRTALLTIITAGALALIAGGCAKPHDPGASAQPAPSVTAAKYHCPMHPTVVSDKPGDCPICGMRLVPIPPSTPPGSTTNATNTAAELAPVSITAETRQLMGLTLGKVERRPLAREVRTTARILAAEPQLHRVTVKVGGWVEKLFVATTGQVVQPGDPLLTIYSPDLVAAQQEYLTARAAGSNLVAAARRRLALWDITDAQIARLDQTGEVEKFLTLAAPAGGCVLERMVLPGQEIKAGEPLLVIGDLTTVWADADIYESDLPFVKVGQPVELTLPAWPGKKFSGTISFLTPTLNPETHTLQARLVLANADLLLKPGQFGTARLSAELGDKLAIPVGAVMFTGTHTYAFRDAGAGRLTPVEITVGARSGDWYELLTGLNDGDQVVTSANFLVDSESSMKAAINAMGGGGAP